MDVWEKVARQLKLAWKVLSFLSWWHTSVVFWFFFFSFSRRHFQFSDAAPNEKEFTFFCPTWKQHYIWHHLSLFAKPHGHTETVRKRQQRQQAEASQWMLADAPGGPWGPWRRRQGLTRCSLEYWSSTCNENINSSVATNRHSTTNINCLVTAEETSKFLWKLNLLGRRRRRACRDRPPPSFTGIFNKSGNEGGKTFKTDWLTADSFMRKLLLLQQGSACH